MRNLVIHTDHLILLGCWNQGGYDWPDVYLKWGIQEMHSEL